MSEQQHIESIDKEVAELRSIIRKRLIIKNELQRKQNCKVGTRWVIDAHGDIIDPNESVQNAGN